MSRFNKPQTIFNEDLEALAKKFGAIPTAYTKASDIIDAGLLTQEEFDNLPYCPRSEEMKSATSWPKIGGRKVYPLSGALTSEETEMYYEYKRSHKTGTSVGLSGKSVSEETQKTIDSIRAFLNDNGASEELMSQFEALIPHKKNKWADETIYAMFGVGMDHIKDLGGKVNLAYVMFRGPNGEFASESQPNAADLFNAGFMPVFTLKQVKDNLKKLADKGFLLQGLLVDLEDFE